MYKCQYRFSKCKCSFINMSFDLVINQCIYKYERKFIKSNSRFTNTSTDLLTVKVHL